MDRKKKMREMELLLRENHERSLLENVQTERGSGPAFLARGTHSRQSIPNPPRPNKRPANLFCHLSLAHGHSYSSTSHCLRRPPSHQGRADSSRQEQYVPQCRNVCPPPDPSRVDQTWERRSLALHLKLAFLWSPDTDLGDV